MGVVNGAAPIEPPSELATGSCADSHADAQNGAFERSEQPLASSGSISPRERAMEALRTIASGTAIESFTPAADDLDYQLFCGMESAVSDIFNSNLADGEDSAGSSLELQQLLGDRGYRENQVALSAVCARALGASLPAQVVKGQGAYVSLLNIGKRLRKAERAHTKSLKKLESSRCVGETTT
jgi:hypothetical protein